MPRIPNRESDLARPRSRSGKKQNSRGNVGTAITKGTMRPLTIPEPDSDWHHVARQLWDACLESGQSVYYQNSDVALLYSLCDDLSEVKKSKRPSSMMLQTIYSQLGNLLVSEGERRKARIELAEPEAEGPAPSLVAIDTYKRDLGVEDDS